jgi:hypothetical protein
MLQQYFSSIQFEFLPTFLKILFSSSTIWLPILLFAAFMNLWIKYTRTLHVIKQGGVLLEIKLPRDIFKSPLAMELILTSLYQAAKGDYIKTFLKGNIRPWFTLEIVSIDGNVRFFIWSHPRFRKLIESQFYAQYPGVEIYEAEDYTKNVFIDTANLPLWGAHFKLTKDDIYPIKTYIDYGLDREQEEESKVDPMSSSLEFLGSLKAGEQIWIQILFQAHRKQTLKDDAILKTKDDWKKAGKKEIKKLLDEINSGDEDTGRRAPTPGEKDTIAALERSLSKFPFEVGIRGFYIARKESFDPIGIAGLIGSLRQYNSETLNGFRPAKNTDFDYPWQDFRRKRRTEKEKKLLNAYKLRSFFNVPYKYIFTKPFILTTEELATIFHLPGRTVGTPTLTKIQSRKNEAPANLPI